MLPPRIATVDCETYYSARFSLSKISTQEYIMSPEFELIGGSIAIDDEEPMWYVGEAAFVAALYAIDWRNTALLAQNTPFDGAILAWRYGVIPAMYIDTMSIANTTGISALAGGASLDKQAKFAVSAGYQMPLKGDAVHNNIGLRLKDFSAQRLAAYGDYCKNDCVLTRALYGIYKDYINVKELRWHDLVMRKYCIPQFAVDAITVENETLRVEARRKEVAERVSQLLGVGSPAELLPIVNSNQKFADALRSFGEEPQTKTSKTTGNPTFAFAKTDSYMQELLEHDDENIRALAEARLGLKSSIELTRCAKFAAIAEQGFAPLPYKISGTVSHRLAGGGGINVQNLPSGRKPGQSKALRKSLVPVGENNSVAVFDSAQVEVRVLAWLVNQQSLIELFKRGGDPYAELAGVLYNADPADIKRLSKDETTKEYLWRQTGKVGVLSLGYGAGAASTRNIAKVQYGIELTQQEVQHLVDTYRSTNFKVPAAWKLVDGALRHMIAGGSGTILGPNNDSIKYDGARKVMGKLMPGFRLPDGVWVNLHNLRYEADGNKLQIVYDEYKGSKPVPCRTWGGAMIGTITQATAFAIIKHQGLSLMDAGMPPALNTHDEFAVILPDDKVDLMIPIAEACMKSTPAWAAGCPIGCGYGVGKTYGDAK